MYYVIIILTTVHSKRPCSEREEGINGIFWSGDAGPNIDDYSKVLLIVILRLLYQVIVTSSNTR